MEVGDTTEIVCPQTKMKCTIEFHQKPTFGGSAKINSLSGTITHDGEELATFAGHWDNVVHITRTGGEKEELFNVAKEPVKAKCVLPLAEQNPWESRRCVVAVWVFCVCSAVLTVLAGCLSLSLSLCLCACLCSLCSLWREATELLEKRPTVDWDAVDRAKGALEEEQRKLPCHQEEPGPWDTKKFHLRAFDNPLTGEKEEMYVFDHAVRANKNTTPALVCCCCACERWLLVVASVCVCLCMCVCVFVSPCLCLCPCPCPCLVVAGCVRRCCTLAVGISRPSCAVRRTLRRTRKGNP